MKKQDVLTKVNELKGDIINLAALDTELTKLGGKSIFDEEFGENVLENKNPSFLFYDKESNDRYNIMIEFEFVNEADEKAANDILNKYYNDECTGSDIFNFIFENKLNVEITDVTEL